MNLKVIEKTMPESIKDFIEFCITGDDQIICPICYKLTNECHDILDLFNTDILESVSKRKIPNKQECFVCNSCVKNLIVDTCLKIPKWNHDKNNLEMARRSFDWFKKIGLYEKMPNCPLCDEKLLLQTINGGHVCYNEKCKNFNYTYCFYVKHCKGLARDDTFDGFYGSIKHYELPTLQLCKQCDEQCKCEWVDEPIESNPKIKKIDVNCSRHGEKKIQDVTILSEIEK